MLRNFTELNFYDKENLHFDACVGEIDYGFLISIERSIDRFYQFCILQVILKDKEQTDKYNYFADKKFAKKCPSSIPF